MITQDPEAQLILIKHIFAREYGWTPKQVEELDSVDADLLLHIIALEKRAQEAEARKCLIESK